MKLHVPDMSCGHCVASITKAIKAVESEAHVVCDLATRTVEVAIHANVQPDKVVSALDEIGFTANLIEADA
jgi:copper chaperone